MLENDGEASFSAVIEEELSGLSLPVFIFPCVGVVGCTVSDVWLYYGKF